MNGLRDGVNLAWRTGNGLRERVTPSWTAFLHVRAVRDSSVTRRMALRARMNLNQRAVSPFAGQVKALRAGVPESDG
jgi:hypothetical protein